MNPTSPLLLLVLLAATGLNRAQFRTSLLDLCGILPSLSRPANHSRIFYAVMFDAGSTGTRIHVYTFIQSSSSKTRKSFHALYAYKILLKFVFWLINRSGYQRICLACTPFSYFIKPVNSEAISHIGLNLPDKSCICMLRGLRHLRAFNSCFIFDDVGGCCAFPEQLPVLDNEMFHSIKPGLSAYADRPETAGETVRMLLKVARKTVPRLDWKRTPVVLRATAGLRFLPAAKAQTLLDQVQLVFDESPFLVPDNSVSIMNGTNEGILAWISLNFLTGHLNAHATKTVGILDLGGGSTQITFLPKLRKTIESAPEDDYAARFDFLNSTFELYTHSYLGNGLMAARLSTLGALGAEGLEWQVFGSACLPTKFRDAWSFGGLTYQVSGDQDGHAGYKLCYQEVLKVVKGIIHQPYELEDSKVFYAFSYYFDRAVDAGLINNVQGGMLQVRDFKKRAKEVCNKMTKYPPVSPFLCMDLTYITCLLKDGFGFKDSTILQLTKKVKNVEASWALGAMLDHFHNLRIH